MARDKIIVISTHILEEVHAVCTRAIIIANGRVVADATPDEAGGALALPPGGVAVRARRSRRDAGALTGVCRRGRGRDRHRRTRCITAFPRKGRRSSPDVTRLIQRPQAGRQRGACSSAAAWTKSSARSPRPEPAHESRLRDLQARAGELFRHARRLCVHRDLPGAGGLLHLLPRRILRARPGRPAPFFTSTPGCTCSWCRRWRCACGPRSARPARSSCC
jgi:hypothetical protein